MVAGPIELLLDLIEKRKLSVNEVSLAAIADDYLARVQKLIAVSPQEITQFLVVAATIMLIKSRSLLPGLPFSEEEEESARDLERRLALLKLTRERSHAIGALVRQHQRMYSRDSITDIPRLFYPPPDMTLATLQSIVRRIRAALPHRSLGTPLPQRTIQHIVSLEEKTHELLSRVQKIIHDSFQSFVGDKKEKSHIIVSFLALLELIKQGHISVEQEGHFSDITIKKIMERNAGVV